MSNKKKNKLDSMGKLDLFELDESQRFEIQKAALDPFVGSMEYDIVFRPDKLDNELAKFIDGQKRGD